MIILFRMGLCGWIIENAHSFSASRRCFWNVRNIAVSPETARRVWLQTDLHTQTASASDVTCSIFYFVLFIDNFLFESLNILQQ